jgi:hypothetical protein
MPWIPVARRALFQVRAATDLVWYANYATERSIDPQFLGRSEIYIRRITLLRGGGIRQHPGAAELRGRRPGAPRREQRHGRLAVRLTPKFSVEVAGRIDETRFDADEEFDVSAFSARSTTRRPATASPPAHRVTPLTTVVVRYERIDDEFSSRRCAIPTACA